MTTTLGVPVTELRINLLGRFGVFVDGTPVRFATRRTEALFAYLACTGGPHTRAYLGELLWDSRAADKAAGNLRVLLSNLRQSVGDYVEITRSTVGFCPPQGTTLRLDARAATDRAADLLHAASIEGEAPDEGEIREVLSLFEGTFLEDVDVAAGGGFEDWLRLERESVEETRVALLTQLVETELAGTRTSAALEESGRLLALDPLHEHAHQLRIRAHVQAGDLKSAVQQFEVLETMLRREFGAEPSPSSRALLAGAPAVVRNEPARRGTRNLPPRPAEHRRLPWSRLVDRRAALTAILQAYGDASEGRGRCVVVHGETGTGKTFLLRHAVRLIVDQDRAATVLGGQGSELTGSGSGDLMIANIAAQLAGDPSGPWLDGALPPYLAVRLPAPAMYGAKPAPAFGGAVEVAASIRALAEVQPVVLAIGNLEDIGSDVAALVTDLASDIRHRSLLLVCTVRSEAMAGPASSPVTEHLLLRLNRLACTTMVDLDVASAQDMTSFINNLVDSEPNDLPNSFREELLRRSTGHPLMAADLLRDLLHRGQIVVDGSGRYRAVEDLTWTEVPPRTARLLDERLARVPEAPLRLLRAAAVAGEEFSAAAVAAATGTPVVDAIDSLSRTLGRQLRLLEPVDIAASPARGGARYRFRQPVVRAHILADLDPWERTYLAQAVGAVGSHAAGSAGPPEGLDRTDWPDRPVEDRAATRADGAAGPTVEQVSPGSRAAPASGTGGAASTSSSTRSAGSVPG